MINIFDVNETNKMIAKENLDVRTITLGIVNINLAGLNKVELRLLKSVLGHSFHFLLK